MVLLYHQLVQILIPGSAFWQLKRVRAIRDFANWLLLFTSGDSTLVYKCNILLLLHNELMEHGGIETNELNMTLMSHMTHYDSYDST